MNALALWIFVAVAVLSVAAGGIHLLRRALQHHSSYSHWGLFTSLCRLHRLDRNSRRLLKQVVQSQRLGQPARVFTEPQWLDPDRLPGALRQRAEDLTALRTLLFDLGS